MFLCCCTTESPGEATILPLHAATDEVYQKTEASPLIMEKEAQPNEEAAAKREAPEKEVPAAKEEVPRTAPEEVPRKAPELHEELPPKAEGIKEVTDFTATLVRYGLDAPWGLVLDLSDGKLIHVSGLRASAVGSPVQRYNAEAPEDKKLKAGDYIVGVNSLLSHDIHEASNSAAEMLGEEMKASTTANLHIRRPITFTVTVNRGQEPMGLDLNFSNKSTSLVIVKVCEGSVRKCKPEIHAGDRIVAVDGKTGNPDDLLEAIKDTQVPLLTISRPPSAA